VDRRRDVPAVRVNEKAAERERKLDLAAGILSCVLAVDTDDQTDVLAYAVAAWCYARDHLNTAAGGTDARQRN